MSQVTGVKRASSLDISKLHTSKRRKTIPAEELHHKTMTGVVPFMSFAHTMSMPDMIVVNKLRAVIETGLRSQKQIAFENGLSQTMMSQFMNGASRVKGWTVTDSLLDAWVDEFNAKLKLQTDRIEIKKKQHKDEESLKNDAQPSTLYIQPSVIELASQSNFEHNWDNASGSGSVDTSRNDETFHGVWSSGDHSGIYSDSNSIEAENYAPLCTDSSQGSGDWVNFDIQRMFYQSPLHKHV